MPPSRLNSRTAPARQPPQARSSYDPNARRIQLAANATPYHLAHERAHEAQHEHLTFAWCLHSIIPGWMPYIHRWTRVLVEWEATRLALGALAHAGRCDHAAVTEARRTFLTYVRALFG